MKRHATIALILSGLCGCSGSSVAPAAATTTDAPPSTATAAATPTTPATDTPTAPDDPAPVAASKCPAATSLTALSVAPVGKPALGPFDLSTFALANARLEKNGTKLSVYVANKDWSLDAMTALPVPVTKAGEGFLILSFYDRSGKVGVKTYGAGKEFFGKDEVQTSLVTNGTAYGLSNKGEASIAALDAGMACGTFAFVGEFKDSDKISGMFVAKLQP